MKGRVLIFFIIILFSYFIGYGYFNLNNNINSDYIKYSDIGSSNNTNVSLVDNNITFDTNLNYVGDNYYIDFYITNDNDFDMYIDNINILESEYIKYNIIYDDGSSVKANDIIKANSKVYVKIIGTYIKSSSSEIEIPNSFSITYSQV